MLRRFLRSAPKIFIALAVIIASVTTLVIWKIRRGANSIFAGLFAPGKPTIRREPLIEGREGRLLLVDNDLYDLDSGAVLATRWLEKNMPERVTNDLTHLRREASHGR